jgi:hypothetical protein
MVMDLVPSDKARGVKVPIIDDYIREINSSKAGSTVKVEGNSLVRLERNEFYNVAKGISSF